MDTNYISEEEFWDDWGVIQKFSGEMFEFDDVKEQPPDHVWTIVESGDGDDGNCDASPGFNVLNCMVT